VKVGSAKPSAMWSSVAASRGGAIFRAQAAFGRAPVLVNRQDDKLVDVVRDRLAQLRCVERCLFLQQTEIVDEQPQRTEVARDHLHDQSSILWRRDLIAARASPAREIDE